MTFTRFDAELGQLMLARGLVQFAELLECITLSSPEHFDLEQLALAHGWLDYDMLDSLHRELEAKEVTWEIEQGQTLVMEHIQSSVQQTLLRDHRPRGAGAFDSSEVSGLFERSSVDDRYELKQRLGMGGMGEVWLAFDRHLEREVAMKILLPHTSEESRTRLESCLYIEAHVTGLLEHPSIIPIYDVGSLPERGLYYTMRVVREPSLYDQVSKLQAQLRAQGRYYTTEEMHLVVKRVRTALLALQYAHDHGVIHRDLKPDNVLIGPYEEVFLIDWGVARISRPQEIGARAAQSYLHNAPRKGALVGTPYYMSPEHTMGDAEQVNERSDVYGMGLVLYEILTMRRAFDAPTALGLLFQSWESKITPPHRFQPDVPEDLEEVCMRALARDPGDRFASAHDMAEGLQRYLKGVKDLEYQARRARKKVREGDTWADRYRRAMEEREQKKQEARAFKVGMAQWASLEEKERLWGLEDQWGAIDARCKEIFGEAVRRYTQALGYKHGDGEARERLASLYWTRLSGVGADERAYVEGQIRHYDDTGLYAAMVEGLAQVELASGHEETKWVLVRYVERARRLEEDVVEEHVGAVYRRKVGPGSYKAKVSREGCAPLQLPLMCERLGEVFQEVTLYKREEIPAGYVVVTGEGKSQERIGSLGEEGQLPEVGSESYGIKRDLVTCWEWLVYLQALGQSGQQAQVKQLVRRQHEFFELKQGVVVLGPGVKAQWPVGMVRLEDAQAYGGWLGRKMGVELALPTLEQWERAARGVDGRLYAWGDCFDPAFCHMSQSQPGEPRPMEVGQTRVDVSPYGVRDMTGNVEEWAMKGGQGYVCGASYLSDVLSCRLDHVTAVGPAFLANSCGFRLVLRLGERAKA